MELSKKVEDFTEAFEEAMQANLHHDSATEKWDHLRETIHSDQPKTTYRNQLDVQTNSDIRTTSATGNTRKIFEGIRWALGPMQSKTSPLKSANGEVITDKDKQM